MVAYRTEMIPLAEDRSYKISAAWIRKRSMAGQSGRDMGSDNWYERQLGLEEEQCRRWWSL